MQRFNKLWAALLAGLLVAVPSIAAANNDGTVSTQEWLTALGLFLPAVFVALSPANALTTLELIRQALADPKIQMQVSGKSDPRGLD